MKFDLKKPFYRTGFKIKKYSPEILVVAGVTGTVVAAVKACKATLKLNDILEESKQNLEAVEEATKSEDLPSYTEDIAKEDTFKIYMQTGYKVVKLYMPSVLIGVISVSSIIASNNIQRKRNVALASAYTAIERGYKTYSERVIEKFGEDVDKELRYGKRQETIERVEEGEDGKKKKVKEKVDVVTLNDCSPYAKFFDASSREWVKDPNMNLSILRSKQSWANDILAVQGHLFLNEILDMLDIPRMLPEGQVVGWIEGDFVDFGIYETHREANRDFVNGYEPVVLLDFNVRKNIINNM